MNLGEFKLKSEIHGAMQAAAGFVVVVLVLMGIGGTVYKIISPEGWIAHAFGRSLYAGAVALGALTLIAVLAWFSRGWTAPLARHRFSDLLVYTFAGAGAVYLAQLWTKGFF